MSLSEAMLAELQESDHASVRLGCRVVAVRNYRRADSNRRQPVDLELADGSRVRALCVVGAVSPQLTRTIRFDVSVRAPHTQGAHSLAVQPPCERQELGEHGMFSGNAFKFLLFYDAAWWRAAGLSGQLTSTIDALHLTLMFDACSASGRTAALVGFVTGDSARALRSATENEADAAGKRRELLEDALAKLYRGVTVPRARAYHEQDWGAEACTDGCVNGTRPGGWLTTRRSDALDAESASDQRPVGETALTRACGSVLWAGAECALTWNGYIDGALESGELAAKAALAQLSETHGWTVRFVATQREGEGGMEGEKGKRARQSSSRTPQLPDQHCELARLVAQRRVAVAHVDGLRSMLIGASERLQWLLTRLRWALLFYIAFACCTRCARSFLHARSSFRQPRRAVESHRRAVAGLCAARADQFSGLLHRVVNFLRCKKKEKMSARIC